jgi:hypothetical protein
MKTLKRKTRITKIVSIAFIILFASVVLDACTMNAIIDVQNTEDKLQTPDLPYNIVGTNQISFFDDTKEISAPLLGEEYYGQNALYNKNQTSYTDNADGTITDNITGLMWQKYAGDKMTYNKAVSGASSFDLYGYTDWRLPTIKELYSLIIFSGIDPSGYNGNSTTGLVPFIDTDYFDFEYGNPNAGERIIDSQFATSSLDVGDSNFGGGNLMFGVNFADGRIKGYPTGAMPGKSEGKTFFVLYVRGNQNYGDNEFIENSNATITDNATGLMWMKDDSGIGMNWQQALEYAEGKELAGYSDWRLPNIKELQSIVDYLRSPGSSNSAAIDAVFDCTEIINEGGQKDYAYYWSGTTHENMKSGGNAAYISFGRALGYFNGAWQDVHGAGAQRSDPKVGDATNWPTGHGPQGDAIRINNFVRLVRDVN